MGNHTVKFDIISSLPPELTLATISHLDIKDAMHCLLVCRSWYDIISNLGPYWIGAAVEHAEIPLHTAMKYHQFFYSPLEFFLSVKQQKQRLKSSKFSCLRVKVPDADSEKCTYTHCLFSNSDTAVNIQHLSLKNGNHRKNLVVSKVCTESEGGGSEKTLRAFAHFSVSQTSIVTWAYIHNDHCLFMAVRGGVWHAFDVSTGEELFQWQKAILRDGIGVTFGCCENCMTVVLAHWSSVVKHNNSCSTTCSLQIVKLRGDNGGHINADSPREILHWKVITISHTHSVTVSHDSRHWLREVLVVPESDAGGGCGSHQILLQCDSSVVIQRLSMTPGGSVTPGGSMTPGGELSAPKCLNCHFGLAPAAEGHMIRGVSSTLVLSADKELLGAVMNRKLCVWKREGIGQWNSTGLQLINAVKLPQQQISIEYAVRIIALGHTLSIMGYHSSNEYRVQVVSVQTGGILAEYCSLETLCQNKLTPCQVDPFSEYHFTCKHYYDWLGCAVPGSCNNRNQVETGSEITIVHKHHGKTHMEVLTVSVPRYIGESQ